MADKIGHQWVRSTLKDHRKRGFQIVITNDELYHFYQMAIINPCPYCGRIMRHGDGSSIDLSPTLDVIDPNRKRISVFDIQIICRQCNVTKSNRTHREFINYCKGVIETHEDT